MTTTTTVSGFAPLVGFGGSANANVWNALGLAVIGGVLASTLLVLTTTPALYYLFERGDVVPGFMQALEEGRD